MINTYVITFICFLNLFIYFWCRCMIHRYMHVGKYFKWVKCTAELRDAHHGLFGSSTKREIWFKGAYPCSSVDIASGSLSLYQLQTLSKLNCSFSEQAECEPVSLQWNGRRFNTLGCLEQQRALCLKETWTRDPVNSSLFLVTSIKIKIL